MTLSPVPGTLPSLTANVLHRGARGPGGQGGGSGAGGVVATAGATGVSAAANY